MPEVLLFDADDTLYEEKSAKIAGETVIALRVSEWTGTKPGDSFHLFQEAKAAIMKSQRRDPLRNERSRWIAEFLRMMNLPGERTAELEELYWEKVLEDLCPYADAAVVIPVLAKNLKLFVVTNENLLRSTQKLERTGFLPFFTGIVSAAEEGYEKPDPSIFSHALRMAGCSAEAAMMVGNDPRSDIRGANGSGIPSVFLRRGPFSRYQFVSSEETPRHIIRDYFELLALSEAG